LSDFSETLLLKGSWNPQFINTVAQNPIGYGVEL